MTNSSKAFDGDHLDRKTAIEKFAAYLDRLKKGAVIAIDAQWGEGKTWFGIHCEKHLKDVKPDRKIIRLDAFSQDYIEDPFVLISAELYTIFADKKDDFARRATKVWKSVMPTLGRMVLNFTAQSAGIPDAAKTILDSSGDLIENTIKHYSESKNSLNEFKDSLAKFVSSQDTPVVIFVDELDRCKPSFAVHFIERLKHFFDVPNLIFVLLINRNQLEKSIKGVYGIDTDAALYLSKFVDTFFQLPKNLSSSYTAASSTNYARKVFENKYKKLREANDHTFLDCMSIMTYCFNLSLRDIEKIVDAYVFLKPTCQTEALFLGYFLAMKQTSPDNFTALLDKDTRVHRAIIETLQRQIAEINRNNLGNEVWRSTLTQIVAYHESYINNSNDSNSQQAKLKKGMDDLMRKVSFPEAINNFV